MKRRLHVIHYPVFGGPHNEALRLNGPMAKRGWQTTVVIPDEPGNAEQRLREGGIDVVTMALSRLRAVKSASIHLRFALALAPEILALRRLIRERNIDLVQIGGLINPHAAIAARLEKIPLVWQIVDTRTPKLVRCAMVPMVTRFAGVAMTTGILTARAHPGLEVMGDRLIPYYPPVDCRVFKPRPELRTKVLASWGIDDKRPVIGAVGNINPMKGIEHLIEATGLLSRTSLRPRLVLIGAEYDTHVGYSGRLRAQLGRLGLVEGDDVVFLGARPDVAEQMQGFDVLAMGSLPHSEGTPTALLEAAACGIPAVATNVGGVSEIVRDGATGYVVVPENPEALASAAARILGSPALAASMRAEARRVAAAEYDVEICADTHLRAFEAALAHLDTQRPRLVSAA